MDDFITIYYWIRLAVLALVTLLALATAIRMSGRRTYRSWREVLFALLAILMFVALSTVITLHYGLVWAVVLLVVGLVAGYFASRGAVRSDGGAVTMRHSPLVTWVWFVAVVLTLATLLFGESYVFALSLLLLAFAVGLVVGQTAAALAGGAGAEPEASAPEASAA